MQRCEHLRPGAAGTPYAAPGGIVAELCVDCLKEIRSRLETEQRAETPIEAYAREREQIMAECQLTKRKKVPVKGKKEMVWADVRVCAVMAQDGSAYCPRHTFLHNIEAQAKAQTEAASNLIEMDGVSKAKLPATRQQLIAKGWRFSARGECSGCQSPIEWWITPANKKTPMELMAQPSSFSKSHFAVCKNAVAFRR